MSDRSLGSRPAHLGAAVTDRWIRSDDHDASPDLAAAADLVALADTVIAGALFVLRDSGGPDANQAFAYDIAHAGSAAATAKVLLDYGAKGATEAAIACAFAADMVPTCCPESLVVNPPGIVIPECSARQERH